VTTPGQAGSPRAARCSLTASSNRLRSGRRGGTAQKANQRGAPPPVNPPTTTQRAAAPPPVNPPDNHPTRRRSAPR
jgi:hypothetical protein